MHPSVLNSSFELGILNTDKWREGCYQYTEVKKVESESTFPKYIR